MGEYIKELRIERGLSQEALGKIAGVERAAVQKWEKGSVENIKRSTIKKLADYFGVSPCELMKWDDDSESEVNDRQLRELLVKCYGEDAARIVAYYLLLEPDDRRVVNDLIQSLLRGEKYSEKVETLPA